MGFTGIVGQFKKLIPPLQSEFKGQLAGIVDYRVWKHIYMAENQGIMEPIPCCVCVIATENIWQDSGWMIPLLDVLSCVLSAWLLKA